MSDCEKYLDLISAYIDGELPEQDRADLESHLASCENCRALYDTLTAVSEDMRSDLADPPEDLVENVMAGIRAENGYPLADARPRKRRTVIRRAALAAACLAVVILAVPTLSKFGHMGKSGADNASPASSESVSTAGMLYAASEDSIAPQSYDGEMKKDDAPAEMEESNMKYDSPMKAERADEAAAEEEASGSEPEADNGFDGAPGAPAPDQIYAGWDEVSENLDGGYDVVVRISGELPAYFSQFMFTDGADGALRYAVIPLDDAFLSDIDFLIDTGIVDAEYYDAGTQQALIIVE